MQRVVFDRLGHNGSVSSMTKKAFTKQLTKGMGFSCLHRASQPYSTIAKTKPARIRFDGNGFVQVK